MITLTDLTHCEKRERFFAHIARCDRCRDYPFVLCAIGQTLLLATGSTRTEVRS